MNVFSVILIGLSLSMDSFAVSLGSGISIRRLKARHIFRTCLFFALFQFIMPVAGWYLGNTFSAYIKAFDHWIAFGLLAYVGIKMIRETFRPSDTQSDIRDLSRLFILSLATSIDALAIGLTFSCLGHEIWLPAVIIGCVTFAVCLIGFQFGRSIGGVLGKWAGFTGGIVLIGIGIKILIEHMVM